MAESNVREEVANLGDQVSRLARTLGIQIKDNDLSRLLGWDDGQFQDPVSALNAIATAVRNCSAAIAEVTTQAMSINLRIGLFSLADGARPEDTTTVREPPR